MLEQDVTGKQLYCMWDLMYQDDHCEGISFYVTLGSQVAENAASILRPEHTLNLYREYAASDACI